MIDAEQKKKSFVVAITGGIGSGKTTVAKLFEERHTISVIDADLVARDVVEPGTAGLERIVEAFTPAVLDQDGQLDRRKLKSIIFADPSKRVTLESILHPTIAEEIRHRIFSIDAPYCMLGIPLLKKSSDALKIIDRVLLVDCPEAIQVARVTARDTLTKDEVIAIMSAQASREERLAMADDVLINDGKKTDLVTEIDTLHTYYARQRRK